ncbi:MAG: TerD family protein, partial [Clostridia bacterium]|nr:TerD family protein [Clostridia bacterium]
PDWVEKIAITVTIYDADVRRQNFGQVSNAYVRVAKVQNEFDTQGETVIRFDLEEDFSVETALVVCEIYRRNGQWKFNAVGAGYQGGLAELCRTYGVNV